MNPALRAVAIAVAVAGALDPACRREEQTALPVEFRVGTSAEARAAFASLRQQLGADVASVSWPRGEAIVVVDGAIEPSAVRENLTVSFLMVGGAQNVRLLSATPRGRLMPLHEAVLDVQAEAVGVAGQKSSLTVLSEGLEVGRFDYTWTSAPTQQIEVPFVPVSPGGARLTVTAQPFASESRRDDNTVEAMAYVRGDRLRVAFFEPRPSWAAGLVRRALEQDPSFEVTSVVRASPGIDVRTPSAPSAIEPSSLAPFDVVAVGAPEELRPAELEGLRAFTTERAGTVVFLPDRRPSGAYAAMVATGFDEVLLSAPTVLHAHSRGRALRASELALVRGGDPSRSTLAALPDGRPAIVTRPSGVGMVLFSGALDAWRYRGDEGEAFASFWRGAMSAAALAAPPPVSVVVYPGPTPAGGSAEVQVRVRGSELEAAASGTLGIPFVKAVAIPSVKSAPHEPIRLWPTGEVGTLRGHFEPAVDGDYEVIATIAGGAEGRATLHGGGPGSRAGREAAVTIATATRGVASDHSDAIVTHLRSLQRPQAEVILHPMRSGWWGLLFAVVLCAEWARRRRAGWR